MRVCLFVSTAYHHCYVLRSLLHLCASPRLRTDRDAGWREGVQGRRERATDQRINETRGRHAQSHLRACGAHTNKMAGSTVEA